MSKFTTDLINDLREPLVEEDLGNDGLSHTVKYLHDQCLVAANTIERLTAPTPAVRERVARAICVRHGNDPDELHGGLVGDPLFGDMRESVEWQHWLPYADAAIAALLGGDEL